MSDEMYVVYARQVKRSAKHSNRWLIASNPMPEAEAHRRAKRAITEATYWNYTIVYAVSEGKPRLRDREDYCRWLAVGEHEQGAET